MALNVWDCDYFPGKDEKMKEFKKWNLKQSNDILQNNHRLYAYVDEERKRTWKAALEWIKYAGVLEPGLANDLIDEELKE